MAKTTKPEAEESFFGAEAGFLVPIRFPANKKPGEPAAPPPPETKLPPAQFREQLEDEVCEVLESFRRDGLDPEELAYFERDLRASLDELFGSNEEEPGK
ncbi:MAG: hypothetical protein N2653_08085 [Burkholderiales bacterium]|nr:hypothetical protein [Burkholderiales bacterium]